MTSHQIGELLSRVIHEERIRTNEVLQIINLAQERRAYLDLGYPSMFEWLTKGFGYSNAAAYRRIEAARLLRAVPEAAKKLEDGSVSLSSLAKAQSAMRAQEFETQTAIPDETKAEIVARIEHMSVQDSERMLMIMLPHAAKVATQERKIVINDDLTRLHVSLDKETSANLERLKELLSHKLPNAKSADLISYALKFVLNDIDPLKKVEQLTPIKDSVNGANIGRDRVTEPAQKTLKPFASSAEAVRVKKVGSNNRRWNRPRISRRLRKELIRNAGGRCAFRDPATGKTCGSRFQLEIDHIHPIALGGSNDPSNLRVLCRQHNQQAARQVFGDSKMAKYSRSP